MIMRWGTAKREWRKGYCMERMEMRRTSYIQWLLSCYELSGRMQRLLLEKFQDPEELFRQPPERWQEFLPEKYAQIFGKRLKELGDADAMQERYERLREQGISFVQCGQEGYPDRLREIPDAPLGLYYKGKLPEKNALAVAIIGSRDCSEYGGQVARTLGRYLGEQGIPVISGMARGIDGISQQAALEAGGESYSVLGCGVDICYPKTNQKLYQTLMEQGGIISSYPPGTPPIAANFPPRNRIVSGLALAVVVVEAAVRSGTSITVSMALEQGREVYVVPGRVTDRLSEGCNRLIRQGAEVYTDPESFVEELQEAFFLQCISPMQGKKEKNVEETEAEVIKLCLSRELYMIWEALEQTPQTVEEIQGRVSEPLSVRECSLRLMELVLRGRAKQVSAGCFCRM